MTVKSYADLQKLVKVFEPSRVLDTVAQIGERSFAVPYGHEAYQWCFDNLEYTDFSQKRTRNEWREFWTIRFNSQDDAFRFKLTFDGL